MTTSLAHYFVYQPQNTILDCCRYRFGSSSILYTSHDATLAHPPSPLLDDAALADLIKQST
jgi:hypothetical protein